MAGLSGTGLVADDLFLMAHDDVTGRPFLQPRAIGLGLAGGLLAELMLPDKLRLWNGLVVGGDSAPATGHLADGVLGVIADERELHPVCDWLAFLGRTAAGDVARRLAGAGYLHQASARRRRGPQWVPVDPDCAFAPLGRARQALEVGRPPAYAIVLAGLAFACGLGPQLLPYGSPDARHNLHHATALLPSSVQELIAQTQAAVDKAVLAHRI